MKHIRRIQSTSFLLKKLWRVLFLIFYLQIISTFIGEAHASVNTVKKRLLSQHEQRRTATETNYQETSVFVYNGTEFILALLNSAVRTVLIAAPVVQLDPTRNSSSYPGSGSSLDSSAIIRMDRNITIIGDPQLPEWPVLDLRGSKGLIQLLGRVTLKFQHLVVAGARGDYPTRVMGLDILVPSPKGHSPVVLGYEFAYVQPVCFPPSAFVADLLSLPRPVGYPGSQELTIMSQDGCVNDTNVHPLRRCWAFRAFNFDVAGEGIDGSVGDNPMPTNYVVRLVNMTALCATMVDESCLRDVEPMVCYMQTVKRIPDSSQLTSSPPPSYEPTKLSLQRSPEHAASLENHTSTSSGRGRLIVIVCSVIVGSTIALSAAVAFLVIVRRQRRRQIGTHEGAWKRPAVNNSFTDVVDGHSVEIAADAADAGDSSWTVTGPLQCQENPLSECGLSHVLPSSIASTAPTCVAVGLNGADRTPGSDSRVMAYGRSDAPITPQMPPRPGINLDVRVLRLTCAGTIPSAGPYLSEIRRKDASGGGGDGGSKVSAMAATPQGHAALPVLQPARMEGLQSFTPEAPEENSMSATDDCSSPAMRDCDGNDNESGVVKLLPTVIGKGSFGRVVEGLYGGERVAVKLFGDELSWSNGGLEAIFVRSFAQEVQVLSRCHHPNVVRLLAACVTAPQLCLVMERMEMSLERLLYSDCAKTVMPLHKVFHIAISIAKALAYLHPTVVHRDLKPGNVLVNNPASDRPVIKLTDFGLSRLRLTTMPTRSPDVGTPAYMAPECFDVKTNSISHHADIYALGVLLWEMLSGTQPWEGVAPVAIGFAVTYHQARPPLNTLLMTSRCSPRVLRFIEDCWESEPLRRPAAEEAVKRLMLISEEQWLLQQNQVGQQ